MTEEYHPDPATAEWLTWVYQKIAELPYKATARWAFYRLVQEKGFTKDDYKKFLRVTSKARKRFWGSWRPDTLTDDTRVPFNVYGRGFVDVESWFESQRDKRPLLEFESSQDKIVFVAFEAKAMIRQFQFYLEKYRVCLLPFGGDASVHYKYQISKLIEEAHTRYGKPIVVLYFGDYDPKGLEIPENAMRDIRSWCGCDFEYHRIGINVDHITKYHIPEQPEEPGKYQWEALEDYAARELLENVFTYWSKKVIEEVQEKEEAAADIWSEAVDFAIEDAKDKLKED
jgi:hypothetical protein